MSANYSGTEFWSNPLYSSLPSKQLGMEFEVQYVLNSCDLNEWVHETQSSCLRKSLEGRETCRQEIIMQSNWCGHRRALGSQKT